MMGDARLEDVEREYTAIAAHPHHDAFIGLHDGRPAFLVERYDPTEVELKGLYDAEPGDVGMHFLVAPPETPVHGFTRAVITTVMETLFADPRVRRVVVEPDVTNTAVHALNKAVGFEVGPRDHQAGEDRPCSAPAPASSSRPLPLEPPDERPHHHHRSRRAPDPRALGRRQPAAGPQGAGRVLPRTAAGPGPARRRRLQRARRRRRPSSTASPPAASRWTTGRSTPGRSHVTGTARTSRWTRWSSSSSCAPRWACRRRSCPCTWRRSPPRWPEPRTN